MKKQLTGNLLLILTVLIWGSTFVAQSVGMDSIGPFTFLAFRCVLAVVFLLPVIGLFERKHIQDYWKKWLDKKLWIAGIFCGLSLFAGAGLQQMSLVDTDAGKAGFLSALYVVFVPVIGLFLGKKPTFNVIVSLLFAVAGLYLLSCVGVTAIRPGDLLLVGSAFAFAIQITLIDRMGAALDGLRLNCVQCFVCGILSLVTMFITETPRWDGILSCWLPLGYAGVLSMGVAYSLQVMGQKHIEPTAASIIMSTESVVAALCGWWILNERMTSLELLGCALVFMAVVLSQVSFKKK